MKVVRRCPMCSSLYETNQNRLNHGRGKHCSRACQYAANKNKLSKPIMAACIGCGQTFETCPSKLRGAKGAGKYCTRSCRDAHWKGALNPNWQGGARVNKRGSDWQKIRRRILSRDGGCRECGAQAGLHIHHIIPFRMFAGAAEANAPDNLVTLCAPCHRREDARRKWVRLSEDAGVLMLNASGAAWQLARERGLV